MERRKSLSEINLRDLFKFSNAIMIRSTLSKWLQYAVTKTGHPNLVLAMISMLFGDDNSFHFARNFWLVAGRRGFACRENSHC
jgi:hypothetical protein